MTLTNAELVARFKQLANYSVKADSGSTTTLVSSSLIDLPDVDNYYLCFTSGDNYATDRIITAFDAVTGTLTFDAVTNAVVNTDEVSILDNGFQTEIKQAELFITNHLRNKGYDIARFLTIAQLKEAHIYKSLEIVCGNYAKDAIDSDIFYMASEKYKALYELELNSMVADYDANEDGTIQAEEELQQLGQVGFAR